MALNASGLKSAMLEALDLPQEIDGTTLEYIDNRIEKLASAIIDYMKSNTVVSTTVATTGSASAQTGTGTGTIS